MSINNNFHVYGRFLSLFPLSDNTHMHTQRSEELRRLGLDSWIHKDIKLALGSTPQITRWLLVYQPSAQERVNSAGLSCSSFVYSQ